MKCRKTQHKNYSSTVQMLKRQDCCPRLLTKKENIIWREAAEPLGKFITAGFCWVEDSLGQVAGGLRALNRPDFSESFNAQEFTLTVAHEMEGYNGPQISDR